MQFSTDFGTFLYQWSLATSETFGSIMPILAVIVGIVLAIAFAGQILVWFIRPDGTTSGFSNFARRAGADRFASWFDQMTYRPFRGAPRGWQIRLSQRYPQVFPWWRL